MLVNSNYRFSVHLNLRWSVACNQNTVATRCVAVGTTGQGHTQFQSFQVNKIFEV